MDVEKVKNANTKYLGKKVIYYPEIDSTQLEAERLLKRKIENGTIVLADIQTRGRGTKERRWYTGEGTNIAMSIILYPNCLLKRMDGITIKIAKCMVDTIQRLYGYHIEIKDPNDLMLKGKKIGGILTQCTTNAEIVKSLVIGIGFNVNEENFSEDTKKIATSLKREYQKEYKREEIISKFIEILEEELEVQIDKTEE